MPQPECPWVTAQRIAAAAKRRVERRRHQRNPVRRYNLAVVQAKRILADADPRPGKMTEEQEVVQRNVVNAWLDIPEQRT
jgi:hypothetical protein